MDCTYGALILSSIDRWQAGKIEVDGVVLEHIVPLLIPLNEISRLLGDRVYKGHNVTRYM